MSDERAPDLGDMHPAAFRRHGYRLVDWIADYLENAERYPVRSRIKPREIVNALPGSAPETGEPFGAILDDFERLLLPGLTHWNHPSFFAYFSISASAPGVLAEFLSAAVNQQAMLWRTSPAATELEEVALGWLRELIGLPAAFEGVIYDTASISSMHALAAAREAALPGAREDGLIGAGAPRGVAVYCSEQAHSSIDKAVIALGFGHRSLRKIPVNERFEMRPQDLGRAIARDREAGIVPLAIVATVGTTSTTSVDPVRDIAAVAAAENVWLHVDAAYGGVAGLLEERRHLVDGCDLADSLVVNPHKWLFTPVDLSAFYCRRMDVVRQAFSLTPEYLKTAESSQVKNLMDTGIQLGRRFRALKLWSILRYFGAEGLRARIRDHIRLAQSFAQKVDAHPDFERLAPVPLSVVCFRARPSSGEWSAPELDDLNEALLEEVNSSGRIYMSHTRLHGRFTLRLAVGHIRTTDRHVHQAWALVEKGLKRALAGRTA
jgi:aromatic-L-amino-acid decarboxylase